MSKADRFGIAGIREIKSNLKGFLQRIRTSSAGRDYGEWDAEPDPEESAPESAQSADLETEPTNPQAEAGKRLSDEEQLRAWRETLQEQIEDRQWRRNRDQALRDKAQRAVDDLLEHLDQQETERQEMAERADQFAELPEITEAEDLTPTPEPTAQTLPDPFSSEDLASYRTPDFNFLESARIDEKEFVNETILAEQKQKLQETFDNFAVDAQVCDALVGPRVTQFRVRPGYGVRVDTIAGLERNIALTMAVKAVRIQAPIPGEPFVGIEVPNPKSMTIRLREALYSKGWKDPSVEIPLVMGMDMHGEMVVTDLAKAPHMLIAGATGSGKSVCINNFLLSILYKFRPDELELVLIDPKKVEFAMYQDIPHLIHPVVSEPKLACAALKWLVREMESRYTELAARKVRNLAGYNAKAESEGFRKLPYIVLIIDEMADLMMVARNDIETPIARLAQMSRAVGIHTVLATQRPSVNVITGVIKANYPSRAAFMVSSAIDSRTILDSKGAEALQGQGDLLFNPPGASRLMRLQSPFVTDEEILKVTDALRATVPPRYRAEFAAESSEDGSSSEAFEGEAVDPLLKQSLEIVASTGKASTSFLQRKLKIGYNRAALLMEELEVRGYVGPQVGQNPREVFIEPGDL